MSDFRANLLTHNRARGSVGTTFCRVAGNRHSTARPVRVLRLTKKAGPSTHVAKKRGPQLLSVGSLTGELEVA